MELGRMAKQMITFQQSLFENAFNAMCTVQDQTEKMTGSFLNQLPWIPEDGKKAVSTAIETYKKARGEFKKAVDDGYTKLDDLFAGK